MTIRLTEEQWADVLQGNNVPVRVSDPDRSATFVLVRAEVYERLKALFEVDPVTEQERLFQLEQFGKRAGWDDPEMDVYNDLDPRAHAMSFSRGDVVLVDYPFSDRSGSKVRPALVVQADAINRKITDTILAAVSRSTHRPSATQLFIDVSTPDGVQSGLRQNSMIQCENLLTVDQRLIIVRIGVLSAALIERVDECLRTAVGLK